MSHLISNSLNLTYNLISYISNLTSPISDPRYHISYLVHYISYPRYHVSYIMVFHRFHHTDTNNRLNIHTDTDTRLMIHTDLISGWKNILL